MLKRILNPFRIHRLALKMKKGSQGAAKAVYRELIEKVYGFCLARIQNRQIAEDLTQEIFLKLVEKIDLFDPQKSKFLVWFWQLARNTVVDYYRIKKPESLAVLEEREIEIIGEKFGEREEKLDEKIQLERIMVFVRSLGEEEKDIFELKFSADLSYREMAKILDKSETSLRTSFSRIKQKIKENFRK